MTQRPFANGAPLKAGPAGDLAGIDPGSWTPVHVPWVVQQYTDVALASAPSLVVAARTVGQLWPRGSR